MLSPRPSTLDPSHSTLDPRPSSPLVTIAIPTYNRAGSYFPQALQSALAQSYPNLEIIVSDNCSTDRTQDVVSNIDDPRLSYFRHEPGIGQKGNYSFCVKKAKGDYLLLLHDDDAIDEDFVSSCIQAAGASDVGIIRTGIRLIDAESKVIDELVNGVGGLCTEDFFRGWFAGKTPIYCCNTLFNTEKLRAIGGFASKHFCYPDTMAIFRLATQHPRIDVREIKASFRIHGGEGGASRKIAEWCEDSLELLSFMSGLVPESRDAILKEGARFFATANYHRASGASSPWGRSVATVKVMRYFNYREFPSSNLILHILYGTRLYSMLRFIKRSALRTLHSNRVED
jgi:glycosyltransferase involved in cell wall biosynthesis